MDFGLADSLVCSNPATSASNNGSLLFPLDNNNNNNSSNDDEANDKQKWCGFGFMKQERAIHRANEGDDFRDFKTAKIAPLQRSNGCDYLSDGHQKMLSFSSPSSQAMALPYYHQASTVFGRNTGYGFSGMNGANMQQGVLSGVRGPFTPSQWMELEHQALIYKYITANVPIPSYLLNPIRKAFECAGFPSFPGLRSNALGWGAFHLGFASTDPEPGRCRRTDGKKWRCSRDAVADQKYCERHMNRGRHRSRKPVEGQSGHSASGPTTTTSGKAAVPPATSKSVVVPAGGASSSTVVLSHHRQLGSSNNHHPSGIPNINRNVVDKEHNQFSITKHHPYSESEFGLVCSDSLLNPLNKSSSLVNLKSYGTPDNNLNDHKHKSSHPLRQFMDEWPKNQSDDTQLSISITSDFMSSSSSPMNEKTAANSPPRLSRELEMGLCLGPGQANWVPISWEPSMGGPLGEVLHTTTNVSECKNTKPLNLIDTWDNSHRMALSPTGVLQRSAFGSLSNSSAGSSPRAETGLCNGLVIMNPSLPAL